MTDFWENFNEGIEDNAGLLGAAGGLAALKGQQAQKEKLSAIEAQLQKAESRVEKEAQLKRKMVTLEEIIDEALESDSKIQYFLQYKKGFTHALGRPSDSLTSLDDIRFAKGLERKAKTLDKDLSACSDLAVKLNSELNELNRTFCLKNLNIDVILNFKDYVEFISNYDLEYSKLITRYKDSVKLLEEEFSMPIAQEVVDSYLSSIQITWELSWLIMFFLGDLSYTKISQLPILINCNNCLEFRKKANYIINTHSCFNVTKFRSELLRLSDHKLYSKFDEFDAAVADSTYFKRCYSVNQKKLFLVKGIAEIKGRIDDREKKKGQGSSCFIASAVYGSYEHPQVLKLRYFRDSTLRKSLLGRCFISFYYIVGPHLAKLPSRSTRIRNLLRSLFDRF